MRRGDWDMTVGMYDRLQNDPLYEEPDFEAPTGTYAGRCIITRDTPINGGIYLGSGAREAIVVDDAAYRSEYETVYQRFTDAVYSIAANYPDLPLLNRILGPALAITGSFVPYNDSATIRMTHGMHDKKINLGKFIQHGAGVCRHQALLVGYLLERFQQDNELEPGDQISIDRNIVRGVGGHAWARFTSSDGTPYIIDPAQGFVGRLDESRDAYWDYRRPEDY